MITNTNIDLTSPVRSIMARVRLYKGRTQTNIFRDNSIIKSIKIERVGDESKFFGFGICQKLTLKLLDKDRELDITTENSITVEFSTNARNYVNSFPEFYVTQVHRDEVTNELSITAYDALYTKANKGTVADLALEPPYTISDFITACADYLGISPMLYASTDFETLFNVEYETGANFDGTETIREALTAAAEATQSIYYLGSGFLVFWFLDYRYDPVFQITKNDYFELKTKKNRRLAKIVHTTELGDNVSVGGTVSGSTQYIRNNPFLELRDDISSLLETAYTAIGGLTINQFECSWRGNFLVELGDKIGLENKDGSIAVSFLLDDVIEYDGTLKQTTKFNYADNDTETEENPVTLGETLKQTYARVDKANREIELVASESAANSSSISALQINTNSLSAFVSSMETNTTTSINEVNASIETLTQKVETAITAEDVAIEIRKELDNGAAKVATTTGYTFDDTGLTVEKTGSEMKTQITEDGMKVYRNEEAVLTADNKGVNAANLHATTYLIIGLNSRFEDYDNSRTGCFWIGD